ncbi:adenylosuccinate lyase [Buchnera aphidicola (Kurisakia onigurumii)]|uniref:adenylosuccinate lyase n=1 Tax=Buchnera aphidicola TaxID=9 RepID=UPI0031B6B7CB
MQQFSPLTTISPLDGRYNRETIKLRKIFSEYNLIKNRIKIELEWFKKLSFLSSITELPTFSNSEYIFIDNIYKNFDLHEAKKIKCLEKKTNHDIKAVEYYLKSKFVKNKFLKPYIEFIHFGCTSDDINNIAYAIMLKKSKNEIIIPYWEKISLKIKKISIRYKSIPMLSRTHGQPATPSTIGKEFLNFFFRLQRQIEKLKEIKIFAKLNGTVGNYNSFYIAYPQINWYEISKEFIKKFGICFNPITTQIEPHDYISEYFFCISLFNTILIDFNKDIWSYISLDYFKQKLKNKEIGSSVMPHKINPIDFENSEGNLGISNALMNYISLKLPVSRMQRDLTDSTTMRNIGVALGYSVVSYESCLKGIKKLYLNKKVVLKDLNNKWILLCEAIQTVMRKYKIFNSYEKLKYLSHSSNFNKKIINSFILNLDIPIEEKQKLQNLTPMEYIGISDIIVHKFFNL